MGSRSRSAGSSVRVLKAFVPLEWISPLGERHLSSPPSSRVALFGCSCNARRALSVFFSVSQAINFDSPRGGISLVTEKGPVTSSRLLIQKAIERDAGLYTCSPSNTHSSSVHVHIVNGKWKENEFRSLILLSSSSKIGRIQFSVIIVISNTASFRRKYFRELVLEILETKNDWLKPVI